MRYHGTYGMQQSKIVLIFVFAALISGSIIYYQYRFYRTPVAPTSSANVTDQIISGGPPMNGIPAIDEPNFESVVAADQYLDDNGSGIIVERAGRYRFYPFQILVWHMIVNETFSGDPLLITYDPLSESAGVFERKIGAETVSFSVSGKLYNSNILLNDSLGETYWSQLLGQAVVGQRTGEKLVRVPFVLTRWKEFKRKYPLGQVLSRETGAIRDYTQNPYAEYQSSYATWFAVDRHDDRLDVKTIVSGYDAGAQQKAYPQERVREIGEIKDEVGGQEIVMRWDPNLETVVGYTSVDDQPIIMQPSYWFVWAAMHPHTLLYPTP